MAACFLTLTLLLAPCALASMATASPGETHGTLKTHFTYTAAVPSAPSGSEQVDLWIPIPSDNTYQKITHLVVTGARHCEVTTEPKFGNRMVYVHSADTPIKVTVEFDVDRSEVNLIDVAGRKANAKELKLDLQPDSLVPVGGKYADLAKEATGSKTGTIDRMRAIFDKVVATMQYDYKKDSPELGKGDVAFVCDYKKGNCSDLHSYVISLARSEGIPCYLEYGFPLTGIPVPDEVPTSGSIDGYHCWVWFYDRSRGWMPLDASDGRRWLDHGHPEVEKKLVGSLVLDRSAVAFSRGRDIWLVPKQHGPPLNNFIYPYAEADGASVPVSWKVEYRLRPGESKHLP